MIKIREAILVEGRYDKNTLSQIVDAPILETAGFGIFKDKEKQQLLSMKIWYGLHSTVLLLMLSAPFIVTEISVTIVRMKLRLHRTLWNICQPVV